MDDWVVKRITITVGGSEEEKRREQVLRINRLLRGKSEPIDSKNCTGVWWGTDPKWTGPT